MEIWGLVSGYEKSVLTYEKTLDRGDECPVCTALLNPAISLYDLEDRVILEKSFCDACSFMTYTKMPTQEWINDFYASQWDLGRNDTNIKQKFVPLTSTVKEMLLPFLKSKEMRILDYGCGYGNFLLSMKELGFKKLSGFEFSEKRKAYTASLGFNMVGLLDDEGDKKFDAIHCNHVFEHVFDVNKMLKNFWNMLEKGGVLYLAVPHLTQEHMLENLHFIPHIHHFTKENLTLLLERNGFRVVSAIDEIALVAERAEDPQCLKRTAKGIKKVDLVKKIRKDFEIELAQSSPKTCFVDLSFKNAKPRSRVNLDNPDELRVLKHILGEESNGKLKVFKSSSFIKFYAMKILINFDENNAILRGIKQKALVIFKLRTLLNKVGRKIFSGDRRVFGSLRADHGDKQYPIIRVRYSDKHPRCWLK